MPSMINVSFQTRDLLVQYLKH